MESHKLPVDNEVLFPTGSTHHTAVTAMAFDRHTNTQMLTGSGGDYRVKVWDFMQMNKALKPFKDLVPFDGHPVRSLSFSSDKDAQFFLICCGNNQARVSPSGQVGKKVTTVRGDMYISDMANTKGHVAAITCGSYHPKSINLFLTSSADGTLR
mmetsp:Transcript_2118/g.3175  ORF Transcript_2118/g.3175 Transcript_2118/m.3175 type:complete len:154 (-) Transcript_2118:453-914(-)